MRKFKVYGAAALLAVSAIAGGVTYAQETTATPAAPATATAPTTAARTFLGVSVTDDGTGVTIARVLAGSPAETAKLQVGDVILSVNGTTVDTAADLRKIIDAAASGEVVTLSIERASAQSSVDVTLASEPVGGRFGIVPDPLRAAERALGAQLQSADGGYQVVSVDTNSAFTLQPGDVITQVNGTAIADLDWRTLFDPTATDHTVTLMVTRSGSSVTVTGQLQMFRSGRGGFPGNGQGQPNGNGPRGGFPGGNGNGPQGGFPGGNGQGQPNGNQPLPPLGNGQNGNNGQPNNPPVSGGAV